uniref:Myo-inositol 1-phosphate synthase A1 n=1 Tax=Apis cerana TaxID=7461 RepID=V9IB45_APICE
MALKIRVQSPKVKYTEDCIEAQYEYQTTNVTEDDTKYTGKGTNILKK